MQDFSGSDGDDLDIKDDGVLDVEPWTSIVDEVALIETVGSGELVYSRNQVGPDGIFVPGHVCREDSSFTIGLFDPLDDAPDAKNTCGEVPGPTEVKIHEIQGSGPEVAITDLVRVTGVVTGLFEDDDMLEGFFVQEEDVVADTDPTTSEGIFVFCGNNCPIGLAVMDLVEVVGTPTEFFNMSQISADSADSVAVIGTAANLPTPEMVTLPAAGSTKAMDTFEALEGMLVTFPDKLVVSEYFQLGRFGQIVLTSGDRPRQYTDANMPSVAGYEAFLDDLERSRIILDDDNNDQNDAIFGPAADEAYAYPDGGLSTTNLFRGGDSITGLTGVLHWSWAGFSGTDAWRVRPVQGESISIDDNPDNPRPVAPADVGGQVKVASFNVLNYFTTLNEPGAVCGPSALGCRGAHSAAELQRQTDKIVAALQQIDADVVGLIEIENDTGYAVDMLVSELNAAVGSNDYAAVTTGTIGGDAIKVAMIYKPASVSPVGSHAILDSTVDARFIDTKNRPMLAQTFAYRATGDEFTTVVGHLKSKGSDCEDIGDPDQGDGQGNCNGTRTMAVQALIDWLDTDPTGSGSQDVLIIGDFNAYAQEDRISTLEVAGYTNLIKEFLGDEAYSFVFDGQLGYLDHALANPSMAGKVSGVVEWHINADEINLLDYIDEIQDAAEASFERESSAQPLFAPDPYRSSDHEPVIVGLSFGLVGDLNGDMCVDRKDYAMVALDRYLLRVLGIYKARSDLNDDGKINARDLHIVRQNYTNRFGRPCR